MGLNFKEKRDFGRMQLSWPVQVIELATGVVHQAAGRDLSTDGLSFHMATALAPTTRVRVRVEPGSDVVEPLTAEGEVVRAEPEGEGYLIATHIHRMGV